MKYKLFFAIFVVLFITPSALLHAQTVTGTNFELKSPSGNVTAQLTTSGEGTPALFFYDVNKVPRISIGLYADGAPSVVLNDNTGKAAAIMRLVQSDGNPVLVLKENGQDKLVIDKNGVPQGASTSAILPGVIAGFLAGLVASVLVKFSVVKKRCKHFLMFYFYILKCKDGTLYCGSAKDLKKRELMHNSGKGSKYVLAKGGGKIIYHEKFRSWGKTLSREAEVKKWTRMKKLALIKTKI